MTKVVHEICFVESCILSQWLSIDKLTKLAVGLLQGERTHSDSGLNFSVNKSGVGSIDTYNKQSSLFKWNDDRYKYCLPLALLQHHSSYCCDGYRARARRQPPSWFVFICVTIGRWCLNCTCTHFEIELKIKGFIYEGFLICKNRCKNPIMLQSCSKWSKGSTGSLLVYFLSLLFFFFKCIF